MGEPLERHFASLDRITKLERDLVEAERQRDEAYEHIAQLDALVPCDDYQAPPMRTMTSPESQKVAGWAIATCVRVMRGELDAFPEDTRNRLTIGVVWDDERWSLTLARGDYEHAMEAQRNEARAERDEARNDAAALGEEASRAWAVLVGGGQDWQAGRTLGSCVTEAERVVRERDDYTERYKVAMESGLRVIAERDEARRELSEALGLPPSIGPAPGEVARIVRELRARGEEVQRERDEAREQVRALLSASTLVRERDEARQSALRWEGNADAAERETATHRRAAERCVIELAEARQSLRERVAEREALIERVSVLEERETALLVRVGAAEERLRLSVAAWDAAGMQGRDAVSVIREAQEQGARWAIAACLGGSERAGVEVAAYRQREAERICAEARKATE